MRVAARQPAVASSSSTDVLLRQVLDELGVIRGLLERGRGPRDAADAALLVAIRESVGDRSFTSADLIRHAAIDPALQEALTAADLVEARDVGTLFRRLQGVSVDGLRVQREDDSRAGAVWRVRL